MSLDAVVSRVTAAPAVGSSTVPVCTEAPDTFCTTTRRGIHVPEAPVVRHTTSNSTDHDWLITPDDAVTGPIVAASVPAAPPSRPRIVNVGVPVTEAVPKATMR